MPAIVDLALEAPKATIVKALLGPVFELRDAYVEGVVKKHQPVRNIIHFFNILISMIIGGIVLPLVSPGFVRFEALVGPFMGATDSEAIGNTGSNVTSTAIESGFANAYCGYLIVGWSAYALSHAACALVSAYWFGDKYYFISKARLDLLVTNTNVPAKYIKAAFMKVLAQYACEATMPGAQKADTLKVIESMMYDPPQTAIETYNAHVDHIEALRPLLTSSLPHYQLFRLIASATSPNTIASTPAKTSSYSQACLKIFRG